MHAASHLALIYHQGRKFLLSSGNAMKMLMVGLALSVTLTLGSAFMVTVSGADGSLYCSFETDQCCTDAEVPTCGEGEDLYLDYECSRSEIECKEVCRFSCQPGPA